jgi:mono/diheme cytochrome c family protein
MKTCKLLKAALVSANALSLVVWATTSFAQAPTGNAALVGDVERGRTLFSDTYNCYACHGFDAQTGERRLVPMKYTQEGFITFVQNSPLPQMPAFPDASAQKLADIWAYLRTIAVDAPPLDDLPLLRDILARKNQVAAGK